MMASTENALQIYMNKWKDIRRKNGMKVNKRITKVIMTAKYQTTMNLIIEGECIEQVNQYK